MRTAVEWLKQKLETYGDPEYCQLKWEELDKLLNQAKEFEKEHIEEAFINGHKDGWNFGKGETQQFFISTIYYDETYGGNNGQK